MKGPQSFEKGDQGRNPPYLRLAFLRETRYNKKANPAPAHQEGGCAFYKNPAFGLFGRTT